MIEAIVSIGVTSMLLLVFSSITVQSSRLSRANNAELLGGIYARELIEVAKDLETSDWAELTSLACASPEPCHPEIAGSAWSLVSGEEALGNYRRSMTIENVYRDTLSFPNSIVSSGGTNDPNAKLVRASVSWNGEYGSRIITLEAYTYNF